MARKLESHTKRVRLERSARGMGYEGVLRLIWGIAESWGMAGMGMGYDLGMGMGHEGVL